MNDRVRALDDFAVQLGEAKKLTPEEDRELRRLHLFRRFGAVAGRLATRYDELRARDRRRVVREPDDDAIPRGKV